MPEKIKKPNSKHRKNIFNSYIYSSRFIRHPTKISWSNISRYKCKEQHNHLYCGKRQFQRIYSAFPSIIGYACKSCRRMLTKAKLDKTRKPI